MRNNVCLYSHEYREQKLGGKERPKQFFQKHTNSVRKKLGKKSSEKSAKHRLLYSHEYRGQKNVSEKNALNYFSGNTQIVRGKMI